MLGNYEGFAPSGDTMLVGRTLDQRLRETFMMPGTLYPEITQTTSGVSQKLVFPYANQDVNFASVKKYVVGKAVDLGIPVEAQRYPNNTYMLRLAEMYLIVAEAILGNNTSTSDAAALAAFNKVHMRAGLAERADPLTMEIILKERFLEFAMESSAWYDLVSLHYWNPQKAYDILNSQDRGFFKVIPDVMPNPTQWQIKKTPWATTDRTINANSGNFLLPIPAKEKSQAPNLAQPAVEYP
jgi:hypothetical protein